MKKALTFCIAMILCICMAATSAYALHYTGLNNSLPAHREVHVACETKTTTNRYAAVNTGEGYPNPGQLIGPTYLMWDVVLDPHYVVIDATIGKNDRDSHYIYDDRLNVGATYCLYLRNTTSINATYGLTYSVDATY